MRKSPIKHSVSTHRRHGKTISNYVRGTGANAFKLANPNTSLHKETDLIHRAKHYFGTTNDISKAAYLLPDGSLLDFSESRDYKSMDHRAIKNILPDTEVHGYGDLPVTQFLKTGAVRFVAKSRELNLEKLSNKSLTSAQWQRIDSILKNDPMKEYIFVDSIGSNYTSSYAAFFKQDPHSQVPNTGNFMTLNQLKEKIA